ncbi:MAG: hypothetical protein QW165_03700 [Candidatus Woesearchaeota archaeon]
MINKKKGFISIEWLVEILKEAAPLLIGIAAVFAIISIIWRGAMTDQDRDFKRIIDAKEHLVDRFDDKKIIAGETITIPIASEKPFQIAFYPEGGVATPQKCKGRTCLCMYQLVETTKKETCHVIETSKTCSPACGETLCVTQDYTEFAVKKGNLVQVAIICTDKGSVLTVKKV